MDCSEQRINVCYCSIMRLLFERPPGESSIAGKSEVAWTHPSLTNQIAQTHSCGDYLASQASLIARFVQQVIPSGRSRRGKKEIRDAGRSCLADLAAVTRGVLSDISRVRLTKNLDLPFGTRRASSEFRVGNWHAFTLPQLLQGSKWTAKCAAKLGFSKDVLPQ